MNTPKIRMRLSVKFTLFISILIILAAVALSIFFIRNQVSHIKINLENRGKSLARNLAYNGEYGVLIAYEEMLLQLIKGVIQEEDIVYAIIQDKDGNILAQAEAAQGIKIPEEILKTISERTLNADKTLVQFYPVGGEFLYDIASPIRTEEIQKDKEEIGLATDATDEKGMQRKIGVARIGISLARMNAQIGRIQTIASLLTLVVISWGILGAILFVRGFVMPIKQLALGTQKIAGGDLNQAVEIQSKDEIGNLAHSFNRMAASLKKHNEELKQNEAALQKAHDELERRVVERTAELSRANVALQNEITEHERTEEALRESEGRFLQMAEKIDEVFWLNSSDLSKTIYISPAYETVWGRTRKSLYEQPASWLDAVYPGDKKRVYANVEARRKEGFLSGSELEYRIVRPDGTIRWIRSRSFPIWNSFGAVHRIVGLAQDITARKRVEEQIQASLKEKEVLLKEVHHRVKNNMQIIASLLDLQSESLTDSVTRQIFQESQNRVRSMALIHEHLYQSEDLARIDAAQYIQDLVYSLFNSYETQSESIISKLDVDEIFLEVDTAIPCGLILNELISNALKHAFPDGRAGEICINLHSNQEKQLTLSVRDNGVGLPEELDFRNTESLGLQLVCTLTAQLKGTITLDSSRGTAFQITFTEKETGQ